MPGLPIPLDGSQGGAGALRAALSLSLATAKPFVLESARNRCGEPGLGASELACVKAAQAISGASVDGATVGSTRLSFEPKLVRSGSYLLDLGAAGPIPQVVQVLAPALSLCGGATTLKLRGTTHCPGLATLHDLNLIWLPTLREAGYDLEVELAAAGWGEEGGGEVSVQVRPARAAATFERRTRGTLREVRALSLLSNFDFGLAGRQSERVLQRLRERGIYAEGENLPVPAPRSKGALCLISAVFERSRAGFSRVCLSEQVEQAADRAAQELVEFMSGRAALDGPTAQLLLVPLALAAAGLQGGARAQSRLTAPALTEELAAVAELVGAFLEVEVALLSGPEGEAEIRVAPRGEGLLETLRASRGAAGLPRDGRAR